MYKLTDCITVFFARLTKEIYRTTTYKYSCESSALFIEGVSAPKSTPKSKGYIYS